jgi:POLQ-like helicase
MRPEANSLRLLSVTQSKAKMYEYSVPLEDHIRMWRNPERLFLLSVGLLGDLAAKLNDDNSTQEELNELRDRIIFSARFFDTFVDTRINMDLDPYSQLLGSAAYYMCNMPGSSNVLASRISNYNLELGAFGLENLLLWLLKIQKIPPEFPGIEKSYYIENITEIHQLFSKFLETGESVDEIIESIRVLRILAYDVGTPRVLLFSDLIGAVLRLRIENSTWVSLSQYTNIPIQDWADTIRKGSFIAEFWPAQHLLGKYNVFRGNSVVIQMPTSAGKTKATEIIIRSAFLENRTELTVIIAPFRALCHEISQGLIKAFENEEIFVDELSDVLQMDFSAQRILRDQCVIISTPEKFSYILRHTPEIAENIGLIIFDEGHQFDNGTRGITYELLLTSLKDHFLDRAQIVLISAVISNAEEIGNWLIEEGADSVRGTRLIPTVRSIGFASFQTRPRHIYFVNPDNVDQVEYWVPRIFTIHELRYSVRFPRVDRSNEIALYLGLKLANQGNIAIFCGRKDTVRTICERLSLVYRNGLVMPPPSKFTKGNEVERLTNLHIKNFREDEYSTKAASLGVFAHHNNVPHGIRLAVEYALKEDLINFVVCTSTLAQGVNLPIRYLIVTSVYQAGERIMIRDFQNLIGRSGRSGIHTEGSILFSDPTLYDNRNVIGSGRRNWSRVRELLDPSNSEDCGSSLFSFFDHFHDRFGNPIIEFDPIQFVEIYMQGKDVLHNWVKEMIDQYGSEIFKSYDLKSQVDYKINIYSAIESYLMANWDSTKEIFDRDEIVDLAKGTLAYFLAEDDQERKIVELFVLLADNIETNIPDIPKRITFGKTMYGVPKNLIISNWLDEHLEEFNQDMTEVELFELIWPIFQEFIDNRYFYNCTQVDSMHTLALNWLSGLSFSLMLQALLESGAERIAGKQHRTYNIDHIVDICENGFAYHGTLFIGAVIELLDSTEYEDTDLIVTKLQLLQKQMKYGLSNPIAIILYEIGFSDRVISIEISGLFEEVQAKKGNVLQMLRLHRGSVFEILDKYPSYFSNIYLNVAT